MLLSRIKKGEGPPIVLIPGLHGDPRIFAPLISRLPRAEVWGVRLSRGGLDRDARALTQCLDRAALKGVRLVGGSYGGQVALRSNFDFNSVVLTGSFGHWKQVRLKQRLALRFALQLPASLLEERYNETLFKRLLSDGVPRACAARIVGPGGRALSARLRSLVGQRAPSLRQPTLWAAGQDDPQANWSEESISAVWPGIDFQRLPGRHRPYASHPEEFAKAVKAWWRSVDSGHEHTGCV